jgi:hypothetical protein
MYSEDRRTRDGPIANHIQVEWWQGHPEKPLIDGFWDNFEIYNIQ